jgi:acetyl esterase/lipase
VTRSGIAIVLAVIVTFVGGTNVFAADDGRYLPLPTSATSGDGASVPAGVQFRPDISLKSGDGRTTLQMDIAYPKDGKGPLPAVLCLHGGAWTTGSRKTVSVIFELARRGYVAVSADYRLAPGHPFPAAVHDAKAAVRWMRANAREWRIDPERIGVVGYSSGGYLALMLACSEGSPYLDGPGEAIAAVTGTAILAAKAGIVSACCLDGNCPSKVQAVVSHYGVCDLRELFRSNVADGDTLTAAATRIALRGFLKGSPDGASSRFFTASPCSYVNAKAPPILLTHGSNDRVSPPNQSRLFARRLREAGGQVEELVLDGAIHGYGSGVGGRFGCRADDEMFVFLARILKP